MQTWKSLKPAARKRIARTLTVGVVLFAFAAPALAEHFDWGAFADGTGTEELNAEAVHVTCPEPEEGEDPAAVQDECDGVVAEVAQELVESDHPENHGKYVSFVAHCLKGMKGKGQQMRLVAQAGEETQAETAVQLCAQFRLDEMSETEDAGDEVTTEESSDEESKPGKGNGKGKGKSRGKGRNAE